MMQHICRELDDRGLQTQTVDIGSGKAPRGFKFFLALGRALRSLWSIPGSNTVYLAVKSGKGMWLTTAAAGLARVFGARVFLHHHSYSYVSDRKLRMVALSRVAGANACHIVLSQTMQTDLVNTMPEVRNTLVCKSAWTLNRELLDLPLRADGAEVVLGHLSILVPEKGIAEVIDLALVLHRSGTKVRLIIGGPTPGRETRAFLDRAAKELGDRFEYRGTLGGRDKLKFFGEITHFVFPSRYAHEAVPMVLYEAMAAGAVCVVIERGSIPEQVQGSRAIVVDRERPFVTEAMEGLRSACSLSIASQASRSAALGALSESERQLDRLVRVLAERPGSINGRQPHAWHH